VPGCPRGWQGVNGQGAENVSKFKDLFNYFDAFLGIFIYFKMIFLK
jgi:hypothetical protein